MLKYYRLILAVVSLAGFGVLSLASQELPAKIIATMFSAYMALTLLISIIKDILKGKYGVDILALLAISSTLIAGEYLAGLMIALMLTSGEALEDFASGRARRELAKLLKDRPEIAHVVQADGLLKDVPVSSVEVGEIIVVKTGEMVPIDGQLESAAAVLDTANITGESLPEEMEKGGTIISGALNKGESFKLKTSVKAADSQYSKIISLVQEIESKPAQFVRLADRYAVAFTVLALTIAGTAWFISGDFVRFTEVLVVASPCPLILAAPIAFISGVSKLARRGVIVRSGVYLEKLANVHSFAFDKTGTLSQGTVKVADVKALVPGYTRNLVMQAIASSEQASNHVLAKSILDYAEKNGIKLKQTGEVNDHDGLGLDTEINGKPVIVGNLGHLKRHNISVAGVSDETDRSTIFLVVDAKLVGMVTFEDKLRKNAGEVVRELKKLGVKHVAMVTGDKVQTAEKAAGELGITDVYAECLPVDKVEVVKNKLEKPVVFVGDGVNDAPVMAAADAGIAMGAMGSTVTSEAAGVVVTANNLDRIPLALKTAKRTFGIAKQSVLLGVAACVILMAVASFGFISAVLGAVLQEVLDAGTILNALRAHK